VANLIAAGLNSMGSRAWDRWADRLPFNAATVVHLFTIGSDLIQARHAPTRLQHALGPGDRELADLAARALTAIEGFAARLNDVVAGLTVLEIELLRERTDDEHFVDACLDALAVGSLHAEYSLASVVSATAHGMWGSLP
jgi:hypothetical protein